MSKQNPFTDEEMKVLETESNLFNNSVGSKRKIHELDTGKMLAELFGYGLTAQCDKEKIPSNINVIAHTIQTALTDYTNSGMDFLEGVLRDVFGRNETIKSQKLETEWDKLVMLAKENPKTMKKLGNIKKDATGLGDLYNLYMAILKPNSVKPNNRNSSLYNILKKKQNEPYNGLYFSTNDNSVNLPCITYGNAKMLGNIAESRAMRKLVNGFIVFICKKNNLENKKILQNFFNEPQNLIGALEEYLSFTLNMPGGDLLRGTGLFDFYSTNITSKGRQRQIIDKTIDRLVQVRYHSKKEDKYHIIGSEEHFYSNVGGDDYAFSLNIKDNNEEIGFLKQPSTAEFLLYSLIKGMQEATQDYIEEPKLSGKSIARAIYGFRKGSIGKAYLGSENGDYVRRVLKEYEINLANDLIRTMANFYQA